MANWLKLKVKGKIKRVNASEGMEKRNKAQGAMRRECYGGRTAEEQLPALLSLVR